MKLTDTFKVPNIDDLPLSGTEVKDYLIQVVGLFFDGDCRDAMDLLREVLRVCTTETRRTYSDAHDFDDAEHEAAKLAQVQTLEVLTGHARSLLEAILGNTELEYDEKIACGLMEMLVLMIDLPELQNGTIDEEILFLHEANNGCP